MQSFGDPHNTHRVGRARLGGSVAQTFGMVYEVSSFGFRIRSTPREPAGPQFLTSRTVNSSRAAVLLPGLL